MRVSFRILGILLAMFLIVSAAPGVWAQEFVESAFWITPGVGVGWPPSELGYGEGDVDDIQLSFGGIAGLRLHHGLAFEARALYGANSDLEDLEMLQWAGNLSWFVFSRARVTPYFTAGISVVDLQNDSRDETRLGANGGGGVRIRFTDQVGMRVDARYQTYELYDQGGQLDYRPDVELFAGLDIGFGGAPKDSDRDGIPDREDLCAATPLGARVDATGCPIDGDADGVPDGLDQCPATPAGASVDAAGCPMDGDGDGVFDGLDRCDDTPQGASVDAKGCPLDTDGDAVFDGLDQCAGTAQGCSVDASGCPSDSDGDGVCDGVDGCAGTPPDVRVDAKGCAIMLTEKETELLDTGMIRLEDVNFDSAKATITPESYGVLDEVGEILARWPELRFEIGGHTDSQGSAEFNQTLSEQRAAAVRDYLLERFKMLKGEQLTAVGYGETAPVVSNDSALNRAKNRRVEFKVLNTEDVRRETEKQKLAPKEN